MGGLDPRIGRPFNPVCHNFCRFVASCYHIFPTTQISARFEAVARPNAGKMCHDYFGTDRPRRRKKRAFLVRGSRERRHENEENIKGNEARLRSLAGARCAKIAHHSICWSAGGDAPIARLTDRTREVGRLWTECLYVTRPPFSTNFSLAVPDFGVFGRLRSANGTSFQSRLPHFLQTCHLVLPYPSNETGIGMFRAGSLPECRKDVSAELWS